MDTIEDLDDVLGDDGQPEPPRRSRGQTAQAKRDMNVLFADKVSPPSGESWWLGITDRVEFNRRAATETERMQTSKFGRMKGNIPESPLA